MKSLLEGAGHQRGLAHGHAPFGHRLGDGLDVHRLKVFLVHTGPGCLAGDAQNRDAVGNSRIQAGDHVGARGAAGANAHTNVAGRCTGKALGHVRRAFHVASQNVRYPLVLTQRGIQGVDGRAGHTKCLRNAFFFHHQYGGHGGLHLCH